MAGDWKPQRTSRIFEERKWELKIPTLSKAFLQKKKNSFHFFQKKRSTYFRVRQTKLLFLIFYLIACFYKVNGQSLNDSTQLIESIIRPKNDTVTLVYADRIDNYFIDRFKNSLAKRKIKGYNQFKRKKDFIILTKDERRQILSQVDKFKKPYWRDNLFHNSKLISEDTLMQLLDDPTGKGQQYLLTHYGTTRHSQFTNPIFFHDNQMFIIQFSVMYGGDTGQDALAVYEKIESAWKRRLYVAGGYY